MRRTVSRPNGTPVLHPREKGWLVKYQHEAVLIFFLGAFAKFRKAAISFVMSIRSSIRPHGTTRLPLDGFSWNLIFDYFSKVLENIQVSLKSEKNNGYFTCRPIYIFDHISLVLRRMKDVSGRSCRETRNTHFVFNNFFISKIVPFMK